MSRLVINNFRVLVTVIFGLQLFLIDAVPCPSRCLCFRTTVRCMYLQLDRVPADLPPETTVLDLRYNKIREIPSHTFRNLRHLNILLINNNLITKIENNAFVGLKELRYLYLYKNRIHVVEKHAFKGVPNLEQLYIHFNQIETFDEETFANLPRLERLFMHNNKLSKIPPKAFQRLDSLKRLRLDSNALVCDCDMMWLAEALKQKQSTTQAAATCEYPSSLQGKPLASLDKGDFRCKKPKLTQEPTDVEVSFGGTAYFACKAEGDPNPEIVWLRNSNEIPMANEERYSVLKDGTLMIKEAQDKDQGIYECMAKNMAGETKSKPVKMKYRGGKSKPHFIQTPEERQMVNQFSTVTLNCQAGGYPIPVITWTFGNFLLPSYSGKYQISATGSLTINNIQLTDVGLYRCVATNYLGRIGAVSRLDVGIPPQWIESPVDVLAHEGGLAEFKCYVEGKPAPELSWTKDGRPIEENERITVLHRGSILRVREIEGSDRGVYACVAENQSGKKTAVANLAVKGVKGIKVGKAPTLIRVPKDIEVRVGADVEISCLAEGDPQPVIKWMREGKELPTDASHRQSTTGRLYMFNVEEKDKGTYECVARNKEGVASSSMVLSVKSNNNNNVGTPSTPTSPRLVEGTGETREVEREPVEKKEDIDNYIEKAVAEATVDVDKAINHTMETLFKKGSERPSPFKLFKVLRFPDTEARNLARAAEIYDRTIELVHKKALKENPTNLSAYSFTSWLSSGELRKIANLSGCLHHNNAPNCDNMCFHGKYRTIDGSCNNLKNPWWGSALTAFQRHMPPVYENGLHTPIGWSDDKLYNGLKKPNARLVSTQVIITKNITADHEYSHMLMQWGQFLDHDMDFSLPAVSHVAFEDTSDCLQRCDNIPPCYPIKIPDEDERVRGREVESRHRCIEFVRSSAVCGSGESSLFSEAVMPREQVNQLTSFIDASNVYGSTERVNNAVRNQSTPFNGLLGHEFIGDMKPLLPFANGLAMDCQRDLNARHLPCFVAGDVRANEQLGLLSMHTIWVREHNRIVRELKRVNPQWDGEILYNEARKIIGAQMQHVTYSHWLPKILGPRGMKLLGKYEGYKSDVNPSIANVFATAAMRFGHTLINPILTRLNETFQTIPEGDLPLHKAFFAPHRIVEEGGVDPLLRGLFYSPSKIRKPDQLLNSELIDNLFTLARSVALDLAAINIQRGRDHAIPSYNEWRRFCNLSYARTFDDLRNEIGNAELRAKLQSLYGHPDNIDLWVGGVSEDLVEGARVGPTLMCLLADQFKRVRDGDRFWYENPGIFKPEQVTEIKRTSLSRVLCDNGDNITRITRDVFMIPKMQNPQLVSCDVIPSMELRIWAQCCEDCSSSGSFSSMTKQITRNKRSFETNQFSFPKDKPTNLTSKLDDFKEADVDITELRIEGLEELVSKLHKSLRQLTKKVHQLEAECLAQNGVVTCTELNGRIRRDGEKWKRKKCTLCSCENGQINCQVKSNCAGAN